MKVRFVLALLAPLYLAACASHPPIGSAPGGPAQTVAVQPNETVYDVAKRLNVGVRDLIDANHLAPPYALEPGQSLIVPVPSVYTVAKGDTLYLIAHKFNINQSRIAQMNHLSAPFRLLAGQQLQLPNHHGGDTAIAGATADELNAAGVAGGAGGKTAPALPASRSVEAAPPAAPERAWRTEGRSRVAGGVGSSTRAG